MKKYMVEYTVNDNMWYASIDSDTVDVDMDSGILGFYNKSKTGGTPATQVAAFSRGNWVRFYEVFEENIK